MVIGSWEGEIHNHMIDGPLAIASIEIHFAWVLEGRAVQDLWITRSWKDRASGVTASLEWYGTTLRVFDPKSESWRAVGLDPVSQMRIELEGQHQVDDIVQLGTRGGRPIRWTFSQIRRDSFLWQGHILHTGGVTWRLEVEMHLRRAPSADESTKPLEPSS
jgi:hypothetical protein